MSAHSPEPWFVGEYVADDGSGGPAILRERWTEVWGERGPNDADLSRIVACVNACAGIPTEALEAGALRKGLEALKVLAVEHDPHDCGTAVSVGTSALRALGRLL